MLGQLAPQLTALELQGTNNLISKVRNLFCDRETGVACGVKLMPAAHAAWPAGAAQRCLLPVHT